MMMMMMIMVVVVVDDGGGGVFLKHTQQKLIELKMGQKPPLYTTIINFIFVLVGTRTKTGYVTLEAHTYEKYLLYRYPKTLLLR